MNYFPTNEDDYVRIPTSWLFTEDAKPVGLCDLCKLEKWVKIKTSGNHDYLVCFRCSEGR